MIKEQYGEHIILYIDENETKRFNQNNISQIKYCYQYKKDRHFSRECNNFSCFSCGGRGHLAKDCSLLYTDNV